MPISTALRSHESLYQALHQIKPEMFDRKHGQNEMRNLAVLMFLSTTLLLPRSVFSEEGFLVEKRIVADAFRSARSGVDEGCSASARRPRSGAAVFLKLEKEKARRDEDTTVSYILRKDLKKLYVLSHGSKEYSVLSLPLKRRIIESQLKQSMRKTAPEMYGLRLENKVQQTSEKVDSWAVTFYGGTVGNQLGRRFAVRVGYSEELEKLPITGGELELLAQRLRFEGDDWLTAVVSSIHVPVIWEENLQLPEAQVLYREQVTAVTETTFTAVDFEVPSDYRKVPYKPFCFLQW